MISKTKGYTIYTTSPMDYPNLFWKRKQFLIAILFLFVINGAIIFYTDVTQSRYIRLVSTALFLMAYIFMSKKRNRYVTTVLVFLLLKDVFIQSYEENSGYILYLAFGVLAYATLIVERLPKLKEIGFNSTLIFVSILLIAANTYTLHVIMNMIGFVFESAAQVAMFYSYGAFMMILAVVAVAYNNQANSNRSLLFTFIVFAFILSDITALFAYYFGIDFCYYIDRLSYLLGFVLLVNYGLNFGLMREEKQQLDELLDDNYAEDGDVEYSAFAKAYLEEYEIADSKASLYTFIKKSSQKDN